jgi:glycosyltransferase involved in cell wall biosynthesis
MATVSILALGFRGIPDVPGGVEAHAAELYPRLVALGADVTVVGRSAYRPPLAPSTWQGVKLKWLWCPKIQGIEALVHTFIGVLYAALRRPDVVHLHAVGPWLFVPLAKLLGLKVVITHHGEDYLREKWNAPARALLRLGERLGMTFADERIVISKSTLRLARETYGRPATLIPNGVTNLRPVESTRLTSKYGLVPLRYIIQVSRLVPEKRQLDLIAAFNAAQLPDWKLLLVGGAQGSQHYANKVREQCAGNPAIINTGFLTPPEVQELLSHAGIFALPSSHEGLPIALLEAMVLGTPVLASDIPANREMALDETCYFPVGDTSMLAARLRELSQATPAARAIMAALLKAACGRFDWDKIAESTMQTMMRAAGPPPQPAPQDGAGERLAEYMRPARKL